MKIQDLSELKEILKNSSNGLLIYGAGKVSMTVVKYMAKNNYPRPKAILVSCMDNNPGEIMGISVYSATEYRVNAESDTVLCCVMERIQNEIAEELEELMYEKVYYINDDTYRQIVYKIGDYDIENYFGIRKILAEEELNRRRITKFIPKPCIEYIIFNILDHCNLRCRGCDHFACIADEYFVEYESVHRDIVRMAELFDGSYVNQVAVMGGEPLLHADLLKILKDVRENFPHTIIRLTTNGLLLLQQDDIFWDTCSKYNVTIVNTRYPISLNYDAIENKAKEWNVSFQYFEGTGKHIGKKSFKKNIDISGNGNPVDNFAKCPISNYVNFIMEGKLYECPFSCQSNRIFNKKFGMNLYMSEKDYLDIYKVKDMQEILEFTAKPKYYCRYCSKGLTDFQPWSQSKGEISEWIDI